MKSAISLITGLVALVIGCAAQAPSVKTQDLPERGRTTRAESVQDKFNRLKELDPKSSEGAASLDGYVMGPRTERTLRATAGIYAGTKTVITDGEGHFFPEGRDMPSARSEAMKRVYKEADVDGDMVITSTEAGELYRKVYRQYAQKVSPEELKLKVCDSGKKWSSGTCKDRFDDGVDRCQFTYSQQSDIEFEQRFEESHCDGLAFKDGIDPKPCKAQVAAKYRAKAEQAKQTYAICAEQNNAAFATCTAEAEKAHQQCLLKDIKDLFPIPERGRITLHKDGLSTWGVDETSEPPTLFERVYDNGE